MKSPSLRDAVRDAVVTNLAEIEEAAEGRHWRSPSWGIAHALRYDPDLIDLAAVEALDRIEPILEEMNAAGELPLSATYPGDPWRAATGGKDSAERESDPVEDFLACWDQMDKSKSLRAAAARARRRAPAMAEEMGGKFLHPVRAGFVRFVALAGELAAMGEPFVLAVEPVAERLGTDRRTVGRWKATAIKRGLLEQVKAPVRGRAAARFRLGPRHPDL